MKKILLLLILVMAPRAWSECGLNVNQSSTGISTGSWVTTNCSGLPEQVAANIVTGQNVTFPPTSIYVPSTTGIYEVCAGFVVTTAGSTGATLQAGIHFTSSGAAAGPGIGSVAAATTVGATNAAGGVSTCQTVLPDAGSNLQVTYIVGGTPATNPTYTYWYTVEHKR